MSDVRAAAARTRIGDRARAQQETERAVRRGAWPVAEAPVGRTTGWWGMFFFIGTEGAMFAAFIASYYYLRFSTATAWPPPSDKLPHVLVPSIGTGLLVLSCLPMWLAVRAARRRSRLAAPAAALAMLGGVAFVVLQAVDYMQEYPSSTPSKDAYGSLLFSLTGLHAVHVAVGVFMLLLVLGSSLVRGVGKAQYGAARICAMYWYFLAVLAVAIYITVYLSPYL
ncbi:MAG TPA: cytochrome c oxidase subunit 3 [Marmoricola sp.]|nr:cytochrome c oxidase subunit 3 [Marmoricola sp.]